MEDVKVYTKSKDIITQLQIEALDLSDEIKLMEEEIKEKELDIIIAVEKEAEDMAEVKNNPLSNATKRQAVVNKRRRTDDFLKKSTALLRDKKYDLARLQINIDTQKRAFALMIAEMKLGA